MSHEGIKLLAVLLIVLLFGVLRYAANLVFIRRAKELEAVLHSKLRCRFWGFDSDVVISGIYSSRRIRFTSLPALWRKNRFALLSPTLPRQSGFRLRNRRLTKNVYQWKDMLVVEQYTSCLGRQEEFEKARIVSTLNELVSAAEIAESSPVDHGQPPCDNGDSQIF